MFDTGKTGSIEKEKVRTILNTLGHTYDDSELLTMLDSEDVDGKHFIIIFNLLKRFFFGKFVVFYYEQIYKAKTEEISMRFLCNFT